MVTLTEKAKDYLTSVANGAFVTLGVKGGGCSGMQYVWGLSTDSGIEHVTWSDPIDDILVVDPVAEMYILGSEIDYITDLGASYLTVRNPAAASSCGCGESFGI